MPGNTDQSENKFKCQKCFQMLKLDQSIKENDKLCSELSVGKNSGDPGGIVSPEDQESYDTSKDELAEVRNLEQSTDAGFTFVPMPETQSEEIWSKTDNTLTRLFDFLSGQTEIDHPLCEECTDNLLDQRDQQLEQAQSENQNYIKLLEKLNLFAEESNSSELDVELKKLEEEEKRLEREHLEVEKKQKVMAEELAREKKFAQKLAEDSAKYHEQYNEYKRQLFEYEDAQKGVDQQLKYASKQLERLTKTNVFNVTFHIWYQGHFGTINDFRMGRLPSVPVDWNEINAGWGQAALLLHSLANKIGLTFKKYRIIPYGNRSYIESLTDKNKEFPLYGSGGFKFFWDTKFDDGMVAFLECLQQFKEELERRNPDCCMPYNMDSGRIQDSKTGIQYTIKVLLNSEEQWTKALKLMLTNLKWGLVWVTADGCPNNDDEMETIIETPEDKTEQRGKMAGKVRAKNRI